MRIFISQPMKDKTNEQIKETRKKLIAKAKERFGEDIEIIDDDKEPWHCSLNLDILCEKCKERFAIQKDIFTFSKIRQIFNTPMFNNHLSLEDIYYLSLEEAENALKKIIGE